MTSRGCPGLVRTALRRGLKGPAAMAEGLDARRAVVDPCDRLVLALLADTRPTAVLRPHVIRYRRGI